MAGWDDWGKELDQQAGQAAEGDSNAPAPSGDPNWDAWHQDLDQKLASEYTHTAHPTPPPGPVDWSGVQNFSNAALLGAGIPLSAVTAAAKEAAGTGNWSKFWDFYHQAYSYYTGQKASWDANHPGLNVATELGGSIPSTMAGVGLAGRLGGAALRFGNLGDLIPFLSGQVSKAPGLANLVTRTGSKLGNYALQGGAGAGIAAGMRPDEPIGDQILEGVKVGSLVGIGSPIVSKLLSHVIPHITPEVAQAAQRLPIAIRPGQLATNQGARSLDRIVADHGQGEGQLREATREVSKTFGASTDTITQDVWDRARSDLGNKFDQLAAGTKINPDQQFMQQLRTILADAQNTPMISLQPAKLATVKKVGQMITDSILNSSTTQLEGPAYSTLVRKGGLIDSMLHDPHLDQVGKQFRSMLDEARDRSIIASGNPGLIQEWNTTKAQYKALMATQNAVEKAQPSGVIDPALLRNERGSGTPLGDIAEAGQFLPRPNATGGVAPPGFWDRMKGHGVGLGAGVGLGLTGMELLHNPNALALSGASLAGGALAKFGLNKLMNSKVYREVALAAAAKGQTISQHLGIPNALIPTANYFYQQQNPQDQRPQ